MKTKKVEVKFGVSETLDINIKLQPDSEPEIVSLLLAMVTGDLYIATLQKLQIMAEKGQLNTDVYNSIIMTLQQSISMMKKDTPVIKPSQVFRG